MMSVVAPSARPRTAVTSITRARNKLQYVFIRCRRCATTFIRAGESYSFPHAQEHFIKDMPWLERTNTRGCVLCRMYNDTICDDLTSRCVHSKCKKPSDYWSCMLQLPDCCKKSVYKGYSQMLDVVVSSAYALYEFYYYYKQLTIAHR